MNRKRLFFGIVLSLALLGGALLFFSRSHRWWKKFLPGDKKAAMVNKDGTCAPGADRSKVACNVFEVPSKEIKDRECWLGDLKVKSGATVTAYGFVKPGTGNCDSEQRTCDNGSLSGSFPFPACYVGKEAPKGARPPSVSLPPVVRPIPRIRKRK